MGGIEGGGRGTREVTRNPAGSVSADPLSMLMLCMSRGRKRFRQEGVRRKVLSSPCCKEKGGYFVNQAEQFLAGIPVISDGKKTVQLGHLYHREDK